MKTRLLSLALVLCLTFSFIPATAGTGNVKTADDWAQAGIASAVAKGFVPLDLQNSYTDVITRLEFCQIATGWMEYALGKDLNTILSERSGTLRDGSFSDTADPIVLAAYKLRVINGIVQPSADVPGVFNPYGSITREEAAIMLMNACRAVGADASNPPDADFADFDTAHDWAYNAIKYVRANRIMNGSGTPRVFLPHGTYTRQESIITFDNIKPKTLMELTRAEWLTMLASHYGLQDCYDYSPYYTDVAASHPAFAPIQACAEWEMLPKGGAFDPGGKATVGFANATAAKAAGLEVPAVVDNSVLTVQKALDILESTTDAAFSQTKEQKQSITYTAGTKEFTSQQVSFSTDGITGTLNGGVVSAGEIIVVKPNPDLPEGKIARVTSVDGNSFTYQEADAADAIESLSVKGTYEPEFMTFEPLTDGVTLVSGLGNRPRPPMTAMTPAGKLVVRSEAVSVSTNADGFTISIESGDVTGSVNITDITIEADVADMSKNTSYKVGYNVTGSISVAKEAKKSIPLASVSLWAAGGLIGVNFSIIAEIGVEGKVSLSIHYPVWQGMEAKPESVPKFINSAKDPGVTVEAQAKFGVYIKPTITPLFAWGFITIGEMGISFGWEATAETKSGHFNDPFCVDVKANVVLSLFAKLELRAYGEPFPGTFDVSFEHQLWPIGDDEPWTKKWHFEDFVEVEECTCGRIDFSAIVADSKSNTVLPGATVSVFSHPFEGHQNTSSTGYVLFEDLAAGVFTVTVTAPGYKSVTKNYTLVDDTQVIVRLERESGLVVTVRDKETNTLINGASVSLSGGQSVQSNVLGIAALPGVKAGNYKLNVTASGYKEWEGNITVSDVGDKDFTHTVYLEKDDTVGTVVLKATSGHDGWFGSKFEGTDYIIYGGLYSISDDKYVGGVSFAGGNHDGNSYELPPGRYKIIYHSAPLYGAGYGCVWYIPFMTENDVQAYLCYVINGYDGDGVMYRDRHDHDPDEVLNDPAEIEFEIVGGKTIERTITVQFDVFQNDGGGRKPY
ncbi:MAG: carboxypeptidase regulatory-like domain-containing protein [Oscillospiraceae bacterium]|nr:carboxypeptidase regulatory-like domain-containing protein [Oscillospiraceae bacterium]